MMTQDLFVGVVAIVLGIAFVAGAVRNADAFFQFWAARFLQRRWGRGSARIFYVFLGFALIFLGLAIASGWRLIKPMPETTVHRSPIGNQVRGC